MRKTASLLISAAVALGAVAPTATFAAWEFDASVAGKPGPSQRYQQQAFTLEEMNCFSSDVHALDPGDGSVAAPAGIGDMRLASSSGGTNGIPCDARDPKAPPKKKRSRS